MTILLLLAPVLVSAQAELNLFMDHYPEGVFGCYGVSADGSRISGHREGAFLWSRETGVRSADPRFAPYHRLSGNGEVIVGPSYQENRAGIARWSQSTGFQLIGVPDGTENVQVRTTSFDGRSFVGVLDPWNSQRRGFVWTQEHGFQTPIPLEGAKTTSVNGMSANGSILVGNNKIPYKEDVAVRWSPDRGVERLGLLPGADYSSAMDVSADGSVVVGTSGNYLAGWSKPFLWTRELGMRDLAPTNTDYASGLQISPDGSTVSMIIGSSWEGNGYFWRQDTGLVNLNQALIDAGLGNESRKLGITYIWDLTFTGNQITFAGDGMYMPDSGLTRGFMAVLPIPEPTSLLALSTLLGGLAFRRRQRR